MLVVADLLGAPVLTGLIIASLWHATPRLDGVITDVRTIGMDSSNTVAVIYFEASNASNYEVSINRREVAVIVRSGDLLEGRILSESLVRKLFKYFPDLGGMQDEPLIDGRRLAPGEFMRGVVAAVFEIPRNDLDDRREIVFRIVDIKNRRAELRLESE